MRFEQFIVSKENRAWVTVPGLKIYVRRPRWQLRGPGVDFELASMDARTPGRGALTKFLDKYESQFGFFVQSIINERLQAYLARRGYVVVSHESNPSPDMVKRRIVPV